MQGCYGNQMTTHKRSPLSQSRGLELDCSPILHTQPALSCKYRCPDLCPIVVHLDLLKIFFNKVSSLFLI